MKLQFLSVLERHFKSNKGKITETVKYAFLLLYIRMDVTKRKISYKFTQIATYYVYVRFPFLFVILLKVFFWWQISQPAMFQFPFSITIKWVKITHYISIYEIHFYLNFDAEKIIYQFITFIYIDCSQKSYLTGCKGRIDSTINIIDCTVFQFPFNRISDRDSISPQAAYNQYFAMYAYIKQLTYLYHHTNDNLKKAIGSVAIYVY